MTRATVSLWGTRVGAVTWPEEGRPLGLFEYDPDFIDRGIEISPFTLPLRPGPFDFPELAPETFKGLPGLLADSLPDKFGNLLIDRWLAEQGRAPGSFDPVERLCYTGKRGMGALEFAPEAGPRVKSHPVQIAPLVDLANRVIADRQGLHGRLTGQDDHAALEEILVIGTSAGGARAKAVIAWNEATGEFRSGQVESAPGFSQWLIKFDGVSGNADHELADPQGFGRLEYAFSQLAGAAGVTMAPCRLHHEGGRAHFMTRRFDRTPAGKLHMQSLGALRHFDFNRPRAYSYEQAIETIRLLDLGPEALAQQVRRAFLNLAIRNQDDHVKNIAFLMDRNGQWSLSPAYDVTYAHNPAGFWTAEHQMSLAGKTDHFTADDLIGFGRFAGLKPAAIRRMMAEIAAALQGWETLADAAGVPEDLMRRARTGFRAALFA